MRPPCSWQLFFASFRSRLIGCVDHSHSQKKIRGIVHDNNKKKRLSRVQNEMENLMHHDEQELLSLWGKDGVGMTTTAGGLIRNCAPRQDVKKWSTFVATRCTREYPERCACAIVETLRGTQQYIPFEHIKSCNLAPAMLRR